MDWATRYQTEQSQKSSILKLFLGDITDAGVLAQVAIFVPRHELGREVKEAIERNCASLGVPAEVPVLRGRDHDGEREGAQCRRWREARELGRKGLPVYSNLCRRSSQVEVSECPYFADCEYIRAWRAAHAAPFVILVHSHLGVGGEDTSIVRGAGRFENHGDDNSPVYEPSFNPTNAATIVCDEDPTTSLIERRRIEREALEGVTDRRLAEHILAGLGSSGGLLDHLREKEITPEQVRDAASTLRKQERKQGQIASPSAADTALRRAVTSAASLVRISSVLERLADELASGWLGPAYSLLAEGDGFIAQGRRPWPFQKRRLLVLDGTANAEILRQFVRSLATVPEIRVQRNARVVQVTNMTFYRGSLIKRSPNPDGKSELRPMARLLEVGEFIARTALGDKTLVVANKPVRCALTGEDERGPLPISAQYRGADVAHFGNLRGSNQFEGHDTVIILGPDEPTVQDAERRAMAIWYDTKEPIRNV